MRAHVIAIGLVFALVGCGGGSEATGCVEAACSASSEVTGGVTTASGGAVNSTGGVLGVAVTGGAAATGGMAATGGDELGVSSQTGGVVATGGQDVQTGGVSANAGDAAVDSCSGNQPAIHNLTPEELNQMLQAKDFQLINVHIPYAGEIPDTDVHIAYTDIDAIEAHLGSDHAAKAVLYCRSGNMSLAAATEMVARGYCNIYDMPGGMNAWTAAGFTLNQ